MIVKNAMEPMLFNRVLYYYCCIYKNVCRKHYFENVNKESPDV